MIVDVFMFDEEFDMLECRLHELEGAVDRFIAIEADTTFSGKRKKYHLSEHIEAYEGVPLTVVQAEIDDPQPAEVPYRPWITPETAHCWVRENRQRNAAKKILAHLSPETWVIYGDLDEIPRRDVLLGYVYENKINNPMTFEQRMHIYSTNLVHPTPWAGSVIGKIADLGTDVAAVRDVKNGFEKIPNGGWHLSWFGSAKSRERKLTHFSHQELVPKIKDSVGSTLPLLRKHVDGTPLLQYEDTDLPTWIIDGHAPLSWTTKY